MTTDQAREQFERAARKALEVYASERAYMGHKTAAGRCAARLLDAHDAAVLALKEAAGG